MEKDDKELSGRRALLRTLGGLGAFVLLDCGGSSLGSGADDGGTGSSSGGSSGSGSGSSSGSSSGTSSSSSGSSSGGSSGSGSGGLADAGDDATSPIVGTDGGTCVLDPSLTKGPYWVDEKLDRSDVTSDTNGKASPNPKPGLPLTLKFVVYGYANGQCTALEGAQVDIWHCDATGLYSDATNNGTSTAGQNFLRGYQTTDASGVATFTTIYPGWYTGRAVHIHVKVRMFDAAKNTTTEATTQVFFDDSISDSVFAAAAPYNTRGARDTRNAADGIYGGHSELLLALSGNATSGYTGTASLGVAVGTVFSG